MASFLTSGRMLAPGSSLGAASAGPRDRMLQATSFLGGAAPLRRAAIAPHGGRGGSTTMISAFSRRYGGHTEEPNERVLRYPNGMVRIIRYPADDEVSSASPLQSIDMEAYTDSGFFGDDEGSLMDDLAHLEMLSRGNLDADPQSLVTKEDETAAEVSAVPDSPAAFLKMVTSSDFVDARKKMLADAESSYQLMDGCPWVEPRPMFVMAVQEEGSDQAEMYTLRTKVVRKDMEDDLSAALGRRNEDGSALISVSEMKDGVPVFEDSDTANAFAEQLEADGYQVSLAEVESHEFFRMVREASALAVAFLEGSEPPAPETLATVLRGAHRSLDESLNE